MQPSTMPELAVHLSVEASYEAGRAIIAITTKENNERRNGRFLSTMSASCWAEDSGQPGN
jgi:hypothetical protein